jgi:hypothetical protein
VLTAVAVRTEQVAFVRLGYEFFPGSIESAERELLRFRITMVKLKRGSAQVVTALFTEPAMGFDQPALTFQPTLSLIAVPGIAPPLSAIRLSVVAASDRSLRRVVATERRAGKAEPSSIQRSHFPVDQLFCRELGAALLAVQRSARLRRIKARAMARFERATG